jgi:hypothetical protein
MAGSGALQRSLAPLFLFGKDLAAGVKTPLIAFLKWPLSPAGFQSTRRKPAGGRDDP